MSNIRLFIENEEVELTKDIDFAITKQFEDFNNPTTIINDWSKTVEIPFTQRNNKLFGNLFDINKHIDNTSSLIKFNPNTQASFRLQYLDDVIMTGYIKLNSITKKEGYGTYNITLYGEIGKIFIEMQKLTFAPEYGIDKYHIPGEKWFNEQLNKETVYAGFTTPQQNLELKKRGEEGYTFTDIIGFAPSNAYKSLFDYTQTVSSGNKYKKLVDDIDSRTFNVSGETKTFEEIIGSPADSFLDEGRLKPIDYGEFRGWLQIPFIYFNKLFQIFNESTEEITGYKSILDDKWFNKNNCYWKYLVMTLNTVEDSKDTIQSLIQPWFEWTSDFTEDKNKTLLNKDSTSLLPSDPFSFVVEIHPIEKIPEGAVVGLSSSSSLMLEAYKTGWYSERTTPMPDIDTELTQRKYTNAPDYELDESLFPYFERTGNNKYTVNIPFNYASEFYFKEDYIYVSLEVFCHFRGADANHIFSYYLNGEEYPITVSYVSIGDETFTGNRNLSSNLIVSLNDLWDASKKPIDVILNYCKMFRIGIFVDSINKTITYRQLREYFRSYTISDWTDKIDMSNNFNIEYLLTDKKYLIFNEGENKTNLYESYKLSTGDNIGTYKFNTNIKFSEDTEDLFKNPIIPGIIHTPYILSYNNLTGVNKDIPIVKYVLPNDGFVCDINDKNEHISVFGQLYFYNGTVYFYSTNNVGNRYITDDTFGIEDSKPCYLKVPATYGKRVENYPLLYWQYNGWEIPVQIGYTMYFSNLLKKFDRYNPVEQKNIYNIFWDNYMLEIYNSGAKKITCNVNLSLYDFYNYKPNNFIKIDNQLCLLNKIYNYSPNNNITKCEFITINNFDNFIETDFQTESIALSSFTTTISRGDSFELYINGTGYWKVENISELNRNNINVSPNNGEMNDTQANPVLIYITTTNQTPVGTYKINFTTTGVYGDIFKAQFIINVQ